MVNKKDKIIFLHIPKTGGNSIESLFNKDYDKKCRHFNIVKIKKQKNLNEDSLLKYTIFTTIRNPWDRILSTYFHSNRIGYNKNISFEKYIENIRQYFLDINYFHINGDYLYQEKTKIADIRHIETLDYWVGNYNNINYLYFENLNGDWDKFKHNVNIDKKIPHINKNPLSNKKDYREYYTETTKEIIYNLYEKEINEHKYEY